MSIATHEYGRTTIGLGTFVVVQARAHARDTVRDAVMAALAAISRVDQLMHPERSGSDLRALREAELQTPIAIDPWTHQVLVLCRRIHDASDRRFDPCFAGGSFTDIDLHLPLSPERKTRVCLQAAVQIDLGGIAKGFAVDRALDALRTAGCISGLVNCGGDMAVFGPDAHRIACVDSAGKSTWVMLRDAALASSNTDNPARPVEHRGYYDGRDGRVVPAGSVAIMAPCAALADALTKCLLANFGSNSQDWLAQFDARQIALHGA